MASFVSTSSTAALALLRSAPSAPIFGPWAAQVRRSLLSPPLRAAPAANGSTVKMMESKVKSKKSKKGAGGGGLPAAIDLEIREAEQYLATDVQSWRVLVRQRDRAMLDAAVDDVRRLYARLRAE